MDLAQKLANMRQAAAAEGLPFGDRTKTFNSRLAQELGKWAEEKGRGDAFHDAVFRAYFADGKNIGKTDVLIELAGALDLSATEAERVLQTREYKDAVDNDWTRSRQMGVTAVPTFIFNRQWAVGAQPYEVLARLVRGD